MLLKNYEKIFNDVNAIYSYILNESEIKKLSNKILKLIEKKKRKKKYNINEKDILLISYADTIRSQNNKSFRVLKDFLDTYIKKKINIIHILPFYPSSSDGGFAVTDFFKIDNMHGNWSDLRKLSNDYIIMSDIILNHASSKGIWFKRFLKDYGEGKDFFLTVDREFNTRHIVRARSHKLLQKFKTVNGDKLVWCTFSRDQVDFDFKNPKVLLAFIKLIIFLSNKGVKIFRFDAVAFIWKRQETNCINLDQTHAIVRLFRTLLGLINNESKNLRCKRY